MITARNIAKALVALGGEQTLEKVAQNFSAFIADTGRSDLLPAVLKELETLILEAESEQELTITVAKQVSLDTIEKIKRVISEPDTVAKVVIDEEILGGFRAILREKLFDGSIKTKINKLAKTLNPANHATA